MLATASRAQQPELGDDLMAGIVGSVARETTIAAPAPDPKFPLRSAPAQSVRSRSSTS